MAWPSDKHSAETGGLPLGFSMNSSAAEGEDADAGADLNALGATVPGLSREDYHWHQTFLGNGGDKNSDGDTGKRTADPGIAEVYFPLLAVVLPKWLNGFVTRPEMMGDVRSGVREGNGIELHAAVAAAVAAGRSASASASAATIIKSGAGRKWAADSLAVSPVTSPVRSTAAAAAVAISAAGAPHPQIRRVIFLVSGFGAPRNQTHAPEANSTQATARLMKRFIESCYPHVVVRPCP